MSPRQQRRGPMDVGEMAVTVTGVDHTTGVVMVRDSFGGEFEVNGAIRPKGVGFPAAGERWLIERRGGAWLLDMQIGVPGIPIIEGSRTGMHPVVVQMLDALAEQGLVYDATVRGLSSVLPPLDESTDPVVTPPPPDTGDIEEPVEQPDPGTVPNEPGPPQDGSKDDPVPATTTWAPLYLVTYNVFRGLGPARVRQDLEKLTQTQADIIGLQEMPGRDERKPIVDSIPGWSNYYPEQGGECIMWRTKRFEKLSQDIVVAAAHRGDGGPNRYLQTVVLRDKVSRRVIPFLNTHISAWIETDGHPRWSAGDDRLAMAYEHIEKIKDRLNALSTNGRIPFVVGDMNIDYFADQRVRYPKFPAVKWGGVGATASLRLGKENIATFGRDRWLDHIWGVGQRDDLLRWRDNWVLTGYNSDHRPLLSKVQVRVRG